MSQIGLLCPSFNFTVSMDIKKNILQLISELNERHCTLVAVSKTRPPEDILEAYHAGQRIFGENKVQELTEKYDLLPKDVEWHMIGHLQRNKVKYIAGFVSLIHSVDSLRLLNAIEKEAKKAERQINILLQVHIAEEDTKFGFDEQELNGILTEEASNKWPHLRFCGLMGMATFTDDEDQVRREFQGLKELFDRFEKKGILPDFRILSMGMSGDYPLALEEGSTMVRIGSAIFGERANH